MSIESSISVDSFSSAPVSSIGSFSSELSSGLSGGSFNPGANFSDFVPMTSEFISPISLDTSFYSFEKTSIPSAFTESLADINLDPEVPEYQVPQAFYDAFEEPVAEEILTPPSYLESIIEPTFITEPEIEIPDEILEAPTLQILDREIESTEENIVQEIVPELVIQNVEQMVSEEVITEAVGELASLSETTSALPQTITEPIIISEAIQASKTYESLITAGIEEASATELVEKALIQSGTEPEAAAQIMVQAKIKDEQNIATETAEIEEELIIEEKEERKITEEKYKFVLDSEALAKRDELLEKSVESVEGEIIDAKKAAAGMPTEIENQAVKSGILKRNIFEILNPFYQGDGSYRIFIAEIGKLGLKTKTEIINIGKMLNRKFIPVTIAKTGKEAGEEDVKRVVNPQSNSVSKLRNTSSQPAV